MYRGIWILSEWHVMLEMSSDMQRVLWWHIVRLYFMPRDSIFLEWVVFTVWYKMLNLQWTISYSMLALQKSFLSLRNRMQDFMSKWILWRVQCKCCRSHLHCVPWDMQDLSISYSLYFLVRRKISYWGYMSAMLTWLWELLHVRYLFRL
jgi:hypothetical protein